MLARLAHGARLAACLALLLAPGCGATLRRAYYAPLGQATAPTLGRCEHAEAGWRVSVACQGVYLNRVDGKPVRTVHFQLDLLRSSPEPLELPLEDLTLHELTLQGWSELALGEAWSGPRRASESVALEPWSARSLDLFFDGAPEDALPAVALRLRFKLGRGDGATHIDCTFRRVADGDPSGPLDRPPRDRLHGYRDGWYLPGLGDLGSRGLRDPYASRSHHVFHAP